MDNLDSMATALSEVPDEIWKPVAQYPKYEVSNWGRIRGLRLGRVLKAFERRTGGYHDVTLYDQWGKPHCCAVARIVALAFVDNPDPIKKTQVNHLADKCDNQSWNLQWVSPEENAAHAHTNIIRAGVAVMRTDPATGETKIYDSATAAALDVERNQANITSCCRGTRPLCGGYQWSYVTEVVVEPDRSDERWVSLADSSYPDIAQFAAYHVSNYGRVKGHHGRLLKPDTNQTLSIVKDGKRKTIMIYRLVLYAFNVPNPEGKTDVDHIDGDHCNNHLDNLRWATRSENNNNENSRKRTPIRRTCVSTGEIKEYVRVKDALNEGFTNSNVYDCLNGIRSSYRGYIWERI